MRSVTESKHVCERPSAVAVFRRRDDQGMATPLVSVIMSAHDEELYVDEAVRSILAQTHTHLELIVIDDGSNDATPQILGAVDDPRLRLFRQENTGQMVARNRAIEQARGEYITFMDADDLCEPRRLQKLLDYLIAHPNMHGVGSWGTYIDARGNLLERVEKPCDPNQISRQFARGQMALNGMSVMLWSEVLRAVGGFREQFSQSEDFDLWLRVTERYKIACLPEYLYHARRHPRSCSLTRNREQAFFKNLALELREERLATGSDRLQRGEAIEIPEFEEESGRSWYRRMMVYSLTQRSRACAKAGRWGTAVRLAARSWRHHPFGWRPWLFLCKTVTGALVPSTRPHLDTIRTSLGRAVGLSERKPVYLVIRYDDFGAAYSDACAGRLEVEEMLQREMAARGWPWLCAITPRQSISPENVDETRTVDWRDDRSRIDLIRRAVSDNLCEPAVHGLTHHTWKRLPAYGTEFLGLPADQQYTLLRTSKGEVETLVGKAVSIFIPPWNSYDIETLDASAKAGFTVLSAVSSTFVEPRRSIHLVPCTTDLAALGSGMERMRRIPQGSVVVLLLHPFDFLEADPKRGYLHINDFGALLDRIVRHFRMEPVPVSRVPQLVGGELRDRGRHTAAFLKCYFALPYAMPFLGRLMQRWLLPHTLALPPVRVTEWACALTTAVMGLWLCGATALAVAPATLVRSYVDSRPIRMICILTLAIGGAMLAARSGRNAFRKRYRGFWRTRTIGLRTWTGLMTGLGLAFSSILGFLSL